MPVDTVFAQPLTRSRLSEEIVTIIQKQIMSGAVAPGDKLSTERELAESFKVNRATVREALRKLENLELIDIRHGDGVYAKNFLESGNFDLIKAAYTLDERNEIILNVLEVRRITVPEMACLAAQRRTAADLAELEKVIFHDNLTMPERDIKVHEIIAHSTRNLVYTIMLNFFSRFHRQYFYLYFNNERNLERSRKFHCDIFEAIKRQKPKEARRIMLDVLLYAEEAVKESLAGKSIKE
jgi:GntR family transcriptional regulator, transcriptional repressor for pyruvate dehydrogenase complex